MIDGLKPYPTMKDSGVPWLGAVPKHWDVLRFKYLLNEQDRRSDFGTEQLLRVSQYTGVTERHRADGLDEPDTRAKSLAGYRLVEPDELVVNIMLAWNGSLGISKYFGIVSPAYCVYRFPPNSQPWYFFHLLRSPLYRSRIKSVSRGVVESRLRLYSDDLFRLEALLPPEPDRIAIVSFLDHADRLIRRYIGAKRRLVALLNEQKQAIIHRAVTRGLDCNTRFKPSGNPWFPEIPDHWDLLAMRRVVHRVVDGPHHSPEYLDDGIPFLSARNIKVDCWSLDSAKFVSETDYETFCKRVTPVPGDVLYTKGGTTGVARAVDLDFRFQVWVHVAVLKLNRRKVTSDFLAAALNTPRCYEQSQLFTRGATNQDLGLGRMKDIVLPVPPLPEQESIVRFITAETDGLGKAIGNARREIGLLQEYRARLIADVVTGKLDVRAAAAALPEAVEEPTALDQTDEAEPDEEALDDISEAETEEAAA